VNDYGVSYDDVVAAAARIAGRVHRTPVLTCGALDRRAGRQLFLKCENLQKVGAFKFRGATNALLQRTDTRPVVTHSSGNHAQAVALAARQTGREAHIVMPTSAPAVKRAAVEGYGARVIECAPTLEARETTAARVIEEVGGFLLPPYDHAHIIAGAGTAALELLADAGPLDAIIAPIGGGGLMAGTCIATRGASPRTRLFAAEPTLADDAWRSMRDGALQPPGPPATVADGLLTGLGELNWPIVRDYVEAVLLVDDEAILSAMRSIWERAKIVVEASGAVGVAAALAHPDLLGDAQRVGVILSGGNVDLDALPWVG